ncbi:hypothetical protein [Microbacterium sp.]|uniref:hypothetical protein n=1 Tax=Microbacterium sp. TaxID=51671 RepID=UPI0039E2841C
MGNLIDLRDVYTADERHGLPIVVTMTTTGQRVSIVERDGKRYRDAARLSIKRVGDVDAIVIELLEGAVTTDLEDFRAAAREVRSCGHPWRGPAIGWRAVDGALDYRNTLTRHERIHESSPAVQRCDVDVCPESWHGGDDKHVALTILREAPAAGYSIEVAMDVNDEDGRGWYVDVYADEFYGTAADTARFAADLQHAAEACAHANALYRDTTPHVPIEIAS